MILMIPNTDKYEAGAMPSPELVAKMTAFNQELMDAGVMITGEGLQSSAKGARLSFSSGKATVTDGPFVDAKEVLGGFWMVEVGSKQEAIDWFSRCPAEEGNIIEIRQVFEMCDFPIEVQEAAAVR
nr:YciI family protein [Fimbriimonas ginsengisoli]